MGVQITPAIEDMTAAERIELLEAIWKAMTSHTQNAVPPDWHSRILEQRDRDVLNGSADFVDWDDAKSEIFRRTVDLKL